MQWSRSTGGTDEEQRVREPLGTDTCGEFDESIVVVDADSALKISANDPSDLPLREESDVATGLHFVC